jgi:dTDP-4-amino-4,6-dideoxygalactose transaminase
MIPYFHNSREFKFLNEQYKYLSSKVFNSGKFLQGEFTELLEKKISKKLNVKYCVTCNSCTDAMFFIINSLKRPNIKNKIITSNFTFVATASPILRSNKIPIFSGCKDDFLMNTDIHNHKVENLHSIILVGLFGKLFDEKFIKSLKQKFKVPIIEDLAQNFGAMRSNKKFLIGEAGSISFDPTKILSAPGSGGCIITNTKSIADNIKSLRYHGKIKDNFNQLGYNSQMSELTACYLISKLSKINKWNKRRIKISNYYLDILKNKDNVITQSKVNNIFHKFVIKTKYHHKLKKNLINNNIQFRHHYPKFLSDYKIFKDNKIFLKNNKNFTKEFVSIPNHNFLKDTEVELIAKQLKRI